VGTAGGQRIPGRYDRAAGVRIANGLSQIRWLVLGPGVPGGTWRTCSQAGRPSQRQRLRIPAATGKAKSCIVGEPTEFDFERSRPICRAWPKVEIGAGGEPAFHEAVKPELGAEPQAIQSDACSVAKTDAVRAAADRTTLSRLLWQRLEQLVRANYHARAGLRPLLPFWGQDRRAPAFRKPRSVSRGACG